MNYPERLNKVRQSAITIFLFISGGLYALTYLIIGLASPSGYYSAFISKYLDYPYAMRKALLYVSYKLLLFFNYRALMVHDEYIYNAHHGGIHMAYACMGFGLMYLWIGFIVSCKPFTVARKALLIFIGLSIINVLNVARVMIIFITHNKKIMGIEHHDLFNILMHIVVLCMALIVIKRNKGIF